MKKFLFFVFVVTSLSAIMYLKFDDYLKNYLASELSQKIKKKIYINEVKTNFFSGSLTAKNIEISNIQNQDPKQSLIEIKNVNLNFDIPSIFSETVKIKKLTISGTRLYYRASILNGQIVDNFNLIDNFLKKQKQETAQTQKKISTNETKKINNKSQLTKSQKDKNFIIKQLIIPNILIYANAPDINFSKQIEIDKMTFRNVGNSKGSNHYKDVFAMIGTNVALKLNNEIITGGLKKKFEKKIQKLLKKDKFRIQLKSIIGNKDSDKIFKNLDKLFK
jgi:hypothetical protein